MTDLLKNGDRIRLEMGYFGTEDFTIETFRGCLGIFASHQHREASDFTPICSMYGRGAESEDKYISNYGEYVTNEVPMWMNLPKEETK